MTRRGSANNSKTLNMLCSLPLTYLTVEDEATGNSTLSLTNPAELKSVTIVD